jgi:hypothetical protein
MPTDPKPEPRRLSESKPLSIFVIDVMMKAGVERLRLDMDEAREPGGGRNHGRFVALTAAFHAVHQAMRAHPADADGAAAREVWEACAALAAMAALLAIEGDASWPYRPDAVETEQAA